jgi:hypothetical protein
MSHELFRCEIGVIPPFNLSNVLPPYTGTKPTERASCSPYRIKTSELVSRFATSSDRIRLLNGLLDLRQALRGVGIVSGEQWIDGSFVENVEVIRGRAPGDVDVVTFAARPVLDDVRWRQTINANLDIFDSKRAKSKFGCDHYFLDTLKRPELLIADTTYFYGLFSHQRASALWKGMLALPIVSDDELARAML